MSANPYAAPNSNVRDRDDGSSSDVAIREAHIRHERLLKSVGSLYLFGALMSGLIVVASIVGLATSGGEDAAIALGFGGLYLVIAVASGAIGWGFRRFRPWVRIPATIMSCIGLLGIPVGTMINIYILYLIWCEKGKRILADDYQGIVERTPQVRYRRTVGDWIALAIVLLFGLGIAAFIVMMAMR